MNTKGLTKQQIHVALANQELPNGFVFRYFDKQYLIFIKAVNGGFASCKATYSDLKDDSHLAMMIDGVTR